MRISAVSKTLALLLGLSAFTAAPAEAAPQKVVVFLAMPGAGKSTFAHALASKTDGAPVWSSGDVIRKAVATRFGAYTIENDKAMRKEFGKTPGRVGELVAEAVMKAEGPLGIVEGFRTPDDLNAFRRAVPNAQVVAIEVGAARRYGRMLKRGRDGETSEKVLRERDASEEKLGVRRAMNLANIRIRPRDSATLDHSVDALMKRLSITPVAATP
jgi:dephospho-CoA kinase